MTILTAARPPPRALAMPTIAFVANLASRVRPADAGFRDCIGAVWQPPDCCSHAPPAARDVCAAPLARGHPREVVKNARAEALNNKVKLIVRRAYGFHSAAAALALVHLTCGPVTLTLPHERTLRGFTYDHARRATFCVIDDNGDQRRTISTLADVTAVLCLLWASLKVAAAFHAHRSRPRAAHPWRRRG